MDNKAIKFDGEKPAMSLLPPHALFEVSKVLTFGATKYAPHNWRNGFLWSRLASAGLRHIFLWLSGQDKDAETGCSHLAHAICCLLMLLDHALLKLGTDDRYSSTKEK